MNMRIAIDKLRISGCALVLFWSLVFLASSALACTPAVLVFRHAEDTNPPAPLIFHLTPTGEFHALLYKFMVPAFADGTKYCPVTMVYAATKADKPNKDKSATNSFYTAQQLAQQIMGKDPITVVKVNGVDKQLYEYLDNWINPPNPPKSPSYVTAPATALREELRNTANEGKSSAIFWTSQGLHILGGAIINGTSKIPDKISHFDDKGKPDGPTPPRNEVYVFEAVGTGVNLQFSDTPLRTHTRGVPDTPDVLAGFYVQCFNHVEYSAALNPHAPHFVQDPVRYYCGYGEQSNLGGKPPEYVKDKTCNYDAEGKLTTICEGSIPENQNIKIDAKICNTTDLDPNVDQSSGIYGACKQ